MSEQPRLCGGCQHWGKPGETHEFRTCMKIVHDENFYTSESQFEDEEDPETCGWPFKDDSTDAREFRAARKAVVEDGSGFQGCLRTREDFGCVLWEPKA